MSLIDVSNEDKGINALSIDAGSLASVMSSIGVLEELMRRVQKALGLPTLPKPCEYFDLMVGAGFAGLLVIMLGRLRISLDDAKLHFTKIVNDVFSDKKLFSSSGSFKAAKLEAAVKRTLESCGAGADARMIDVDMVDRKACRVMVCVASEPAMRVPVCLRTYTVDMNSVPDCTIVEAVRAAFALPGLFKPAVITESGGIKVLYVGLGDMNPTVQMLDEAARVLSDGHMSSVMSIGAGQKQTIVTDSERTAQGMASRFLNTPGVYFRFSVEQGMQDIGLADWEKLSKGIVHARAYLVLSQNEKKISELAQALGTKEKAIPVARISEHMRKTNTSDIDLDTKDGAIHVLPETSRRLKECPPPSFLFVGRDAQLGCIRRCLVNGSEERHVCVLHGLGGAGKTQLALKFVELYRNEFQHIFYVDSTSARTIEADLKNIALVNHAGDNSNDALAWLAGLRENWLVVYNNADDTSLNLRSYFPACSHGNILITTRNRRMINFAQGVDAECHVSEMSGTDAERLLAKATGVTGDVGPPGLSLVKELGYFALAIVQAGAYIRTHCCTIADYLDMYNANRGQLLEEYAQLVEKPDDYGLTAYATWRVSYARLKPLAKQLYDLLAFMHHDQITEDIFRYAIIGLGEYAWMIPPTDSESAIQEMTTSMLANFTRLKDGSWDKAAFMRAIDDLQSYSLLAYDHINRNYSIHPLVHEWTRTVVDDGPVMCSCTALLLASSIIWKLGAEDMAFRRTLLNHIDCLPVGEKTRPRLAERFELVYREAERQKDRETLTKAVLEASAELHGQEHPDTLRSMANLASVYSKQGRWQEAEVLERQVLELGEQLQLRNRSGTLTSMHNLAYTYSKQGRWQEAELLQKEVIELSKRVRGSEHPETLRGMNGLAVTYLSQGRWQEAELLLRETLEIRKRVQGIEHPDALRNMGNLAAACSSQGKWREGEALEREVFELSKRVVGSDHPETLTRMANLAMSYWMQGRWQEAEVVQRKVLELNDRVQGSEHPDTLKNMHNLAATYSSQGRWEEAEALQLMVLELSVRVQGSNHPDTLRSMNNLALTYSHQGRWQEAEMLLGEVLGLRKLVIGDKHPETLKSMANLALTYWGQKRWQEAEALQQEVLELRKQVVGGEHPDTMRSMDNLASTYSRQGRWQEAEILQLEVLELSKKVIGSEHPDTLTIMANLAFTYGGQGRWQEAELLQGEALELRKRVIGSNHPDTLSSMHWLAITYSNLGQMRDAENLMIAVVDASKRVLGDTHPFTMSRLEYQAEIWCRVRTEDTKDT